MLGDTIELGNYDDDEELISQNRSGFLVKIKDGTLISYKVRRCFANGGIVTITAILVDGEYKVSYKTHDLTETGELAVKEEVERFIEEHQIQALEINRKLQKALE